MNNILNIIGELLFLIVLFGAIFVALTILTP